MAVLAGRAGAASAAATTSTSASATTSGSATSEVKVFVEAVDSIDFPTVTVFFRVLDLNPDTPYAQVQESQVSVGGEGGGTEIVSGSFDVRTRPISIQFMADASGSMIRMFPAINTALQDFAEKMGSYQTDADEVSIAVFAMPNAGGGLLGGLLGGAQVDLRMDWTTDSGQLKSTASSIFGGSAITESQYCSAIWNAFSWGATRCAQRAQVNHLPRMVLCITDGKDDPDYGGNIGATTQVLKSSGIPCFVIGAGDSAGDPRYGDMVINAAELEQIATSSEGALMAVTGTENSGTFTGVDAEGSKRIKGYMDKVIESYKNIYRVSFKAKDLTIDTGELREISVSAIGGEGKGFYLPPVVVDEDATAQVKYPVPESLRETLVKTVVWTTTYHKGFEQTSFDTPRPALTPLIDQPDVRDDIEVLNPEELTLDSRFRVPTQPDFLKRDDLVFGDLAEPHFRYGVKISPFRISQEELLQGKLIGAFPVYVRDTTPPNVFLSLRSRDVPEGNEVRILENPGDDGRFDVETTPDERKIYITARGRNLTASFETFALDGMLVPSVFAPETPDQFGGCDAFFVFEDIRLRLINCAAQDNIAFASPKAAGVPRDVDYPEIVTWYDYIGQQVDGSTGMVKPRATTFPDKYDQTYDIPAEQSTFLPRTTREELQKPIDQGGVPGITWYLERGLPAEPVENSECFTEWIERGENVRDEPGYPYIPGRELYFRVIARDQAGNETNVRIPIKVLKTGWKTRTLAYRNRRLQ